MEAISKSTQDFFEVLRRYEEGSCEELSSNSLMRLKHSRFGKSNKTLLHLAMKYLFDEEIIKNIVKKLQFLALKPTDKNRRLPIHVACKYGNLAGVKTLLDSSQCLKSKDFQGNSPLALSCLHERHEILKVLNQHPVNFLARNQQGKNSIQIAIETCNSAVFNELITGICLQKATFHKCLQFALENNLKETYSALINELQPSDFNSFDLLHEILKSCRGRKELIEKILDKIKTIKTVKLVILLKLNVESHVILKYCKDEIFGNLLFVANIWNRADLIEESLKCQLINFKDVERCNKIRLKPDCERIIKKYLTWQKYRVPLFVRNFSTSIYSKFPGFVFKEILEYL